MNFDRQTQNLIKQGQQNLDQRQRKKQRHACRHQRFAQELLSVADALEAGIRTGTENPGPALLEGAQATLRELNKAFDKAGIKLLDPKGQPFDPNWHEAMVAQESADVPPNTVLAVIQKGYSLNGRLLRPARVIVSKAAADHN